MPRRLTRNGQAEMSNPLRLAAFAVLSLLLLGAGCAAGETNPGEGGSGSGNGGSTSSMTTTDNGGGGSGGSGGSGGGGAGGGAGGACPDTCAADFPTVPSCQIAAWNTESCTCALEPSADGTACSD